MKQANRILSIFICLIMITELIPHVAANAATAEEILSAFDSAAPAEYKSGENPYGYATNQEFLMAAQNELLLLRSHNDGNVKNNWYSHLDPGSFNGNDSSAKLYNIDESNSPFSDKGSYSNGKNYAFTNAVAFDPMGTGRKDHVAYIGFNGAGKKSDGSNEYGEIVVYVMNVNNGATSVAYHAGWAPYLRDKDFEQYEADNLFAITAGNYSNSDKETFVVYVAGEDGTYALQEWKVTTSNSQNVYLSCIGESKNLLHTEYVNSYNSMAKTNKKQNMLQASLETGDFNGDKIDDLAVLSYINEPNAGYREDVSAKLHTPQLKIARGGGSGSVLDEDNFVKDKLIRQSEDSHAFISMYAPSIAAGDIDGDGIDELVAVGWMKKIYHTNDTIYSSYYDSQILTTIWEFEGQHITELLFETHDNHDADNDIFNRYSYYSLINCHEYGLDNGSDGYAKKEFNLCPQYKVACVALNGDSNPEYIFLNGTFCTFENGKLVHKYTPSVFKNKPALYSSFGAKFGFIDSLAVGVFDGNTVGREQIVISMGLLADNGDDDYHYYLGVVGGRNYNDTVKDGVTVEYGNLGLYYTTRFYQDDEYTDYMKDNNGLFDRGANYNERLNCVVVAVDRGKDGTMARYTGKGYTFSNPNLITVLQAAPYYRDLGSYGDSATTYEFTTTYKISEQNADSTSFSVGVSMETEAPGVKFAIGGGYVEGFTKSFEQTYTESHTTAFTAKEENQVILQRTPIVIYNYALQNSAGNWTDSIQITVPCAPSYVLMTVEEYNSFAKAYNQTIKAGRFTEITDSALLGNAGNPSKYNTEFGSKITRLSTAFYTMNMYSGSITSTYQNGSEDTTGITTRQGYYVDTFAGVGASFAGGSVYGGVETSVSGDSAYGSFTTTAQYRQASGTVYGIGALENKVPDNILSQYGFNWSFGTWTLSMAGGLKLPVYGYVVNPVAQPASAPTNFSVTDSDNNTAPIKVSFSNVNNATGYTLYMLNSENEYEVFAQINAATGNTVSGNYAFPDDYRDISITLAVTATVAGKETAMSPSKTYYRQNAAITAYEIAKANGFEGSVEEWLDSLVGADGKDGQDGNGISDAYINPSTGELTLVLDDGTETVLGNVVGSNGVDGRGINSIELNENGEWVITYTDNTTTTLTVPKGTDGKDGIDGKDGADGKDGLTPHIGENGNWWIGDEDTGVKATGTDDTNGVGLAGMAINEKGEIIVTLDNGATLVIGKLISDILPLTLAPLDDNILNLGETICLKAIVNLPENASVIWTASNDNFRYTPSDDGKSCEIIPQNVGETVFTVFVVDAKVNIISAVAIQTVSVVGRHAHIDEDADNQCDICGEEMQSDILRSDANLDGQITAEDARLALRAAVNLDSLDAAQIKAADINLDGVITAEDARAILRQAVGLTV